MPAGSSRGESDLPQFLSKLYEMVDKQSEDLCRWADDGNSFIIVDEARFAKEVLGHFFKHERFTSFVRQLNMYGFRKIRHLQQGVLKKTTDAAGAAAEQWRFEHPHFRRGQLELLPLIERKKQNTSAAAASSNGGAATSTRGNAAGLSASQVLDLSQLLNGVNAVKEDLKHLKESNEALWAEAAASRERHSTQQDTINRILSFLAGVFGSSQGLPGSSPSGPLMIEPGSEASRFETVDTTPTPDPNPWGLPSPTPPPQPNTSAAGQLEKMFPSAFPPQPQSLPDAAVTSPPPINAFPLPSNLYPGSFSLPPAPDASALSAHDLQLSGISDKVSQLSSNMNLFVQSLGGTGFDTNFSNTNDPAADFDFDAFMKDIGDGGPLFDMGQPPDVGGTSAASTSTLDHDLELGVKRKAGNGGEGSAKRRK